MHANFLFFFDWAALGYLCIKDRASPRIMVSLLSHLPHSKRIGFNLVGISGFILLMEGTRKLSNKILSIWSNQHRMI